MPLYAVWLGFSRANHMHYNISHPFLLSLVCSPSVSPGTLLAVRTGAPMLHRYMLIHATHMQDAVIV